MLAGRLEVVLDGYIGDERPRCELRELFGCGISDGRRRSGVEEEEEAVQAELDETGPCRGMSGLTGMSCL